MKFPNFRVGTVFILLCLITALLLADPSYAINSYAINSPMEVTSDPGSSNDDNQGEACTPEEDFLYPQCCEDSEKQLEGKKKIDCIEPLKEKNQ